jgi:hypothetical protein
MDLASTISAVRCRRGLAKVRYYGLQFGAHVLERRHSQRVFSPVPEKRLIDNACRRCGPAVALRGPMGQLSNRLPTACGLAL